MRRWKKIVLGIVGVLGLAAIWVFWPQSAASEVRGIGPSPDAYDVTILRDTYGVPHVFGKTDPDVGFGLAWAHAEDDFLTIQQTLLAARGKLASVYGPDSAAVDYFVHLLRIDDVVDTGWPQLPPDVRALCNAYADGLNLYANQHPDEALRGLFPVEGKDLVRAFTQKVPLFFGLDGVLSKLFADERPDLSAAIAPAVRYGSNVFAVAPSRSDAGETMLISNTHQPWTGPVAWYEASVHSEDGWDMTGALFPAMPMPALGHNRHLAWSMTVNKPDLTDVYVLDIDPDDPNRYRVDGEWKTLEVRDAPIDVRLLGRIHWTFHREVLWSVFGPVVRQPHGTYAIRYGGMGETGLVEQFYRMNKATTFDEWKAALETQDGLPSFNIGYADETGRIAYVYHGLIPDRDPGFDWSGYVPGDTSRTIWDSYVPLDDLPWVIEPQAGFIENSNSTPFTASGPGTLDPASYAPSMGIEAQQTNRSLRAQGLMGADFSISPEELLAIKFDVTYDDTSVPALLANRIVASDLATDSEVAAAVAVVAAWDRSADAEDRSTALVVGTLAHLPDEGADLDFSQLGEAEISDAQIEAAFRDAVAELTKRFGRVDPPWSEVNRLVRGSFDTGVDGGPDLLRAIYGDSVDGRFEGIAGDSYVMMVVFHPDGTLSSQSIVPFGSATQHADSPHYADQAPIFAADQLKPVWYDEADVRAHLEREYSPGE